MLIASNVAGTSRTRLNPDVKALINIQNQYSSKTASARTLYMSLKQLAYPWNDE